MFPLCSAGRGRVPGRSCAPAAVEDARRHRPARARAAGTSSSARRGDDDPDDIRCASPAAASPHLPLQRRRAGGTDVHSAALPRPALPRTPAPVLPRRSAPVPASGCCARTVPRHRAPPPCATPSCTAASTAASTRTRRARSTRSWPAATTGLEHLWVVRDAAGRGSPRPRAAVALGSAEWHEALARSRHIVTNTHLPDWFERRDGQIVVQTWHGTPLKRIGHDLAGTLCADPATCIACRAAGTSGACWSPRTASPRRPARASRRTPARCWSAATPATTSCSRRRPRQDRRRGPGAARHPRGQDGRPVRADMARRPAYGAGPVRSSTSRWTWRRRREGARRRPRPAGAPPLAGRRPVPARHGFVRDVSRYPDIAELLLITDVLVTDYSSLMFDFANTGRPMLFLTSRPGPLPRHPARLLLRLRGRAPGPLLHTTCRTHRGPARPGHRQPRQRGRLRGFPRHLLRPRRRPGRRPRRGPHHPRLTTGRPPYGPTAVISVAIASMNPSGPQEGPR